MDDSQAQTPESIWHSLYRVSAAVALILGVLFLLAAVSLIISILQLGAINDWLTPIQNNWLIVLFQLNANISGVHAGLLSLNLLDSLILILAGVLFLGLYAALRHTSQIWAIIATIQPVIGLVLFLVTKMAGRSGLMGAVLVISIVMLRSNPFSKGTAVMGMLASGLLLAGDVFTAFDAPSTILAGLIAIGYVLMTTWFFVISRSLFGLGSSIAKAEMRRRCPDEVSRSPRHDRIGR